MYLLLLFITITPLLNVRLLKNIFYDFTGIGRKETRRFSTCFSSLSAAANSSLFSGTLVVSTIPLQTFSQQKS